MVPSRHWHYDNGQQVRRCLSSKNHSILFHSKISPFRCDALPSGVQLHKNVLITGSGCGIGFESAKSLARQGARVYITDTSQEAIDRAVGQISNHVPGASVLAAAPLDLSSLDKVRRFAAWWGEQGHPLDVLVNNAGANFMGIVPWHTNQGVAGLPQVNFLGPFVLTRLLLPHILNSSQGRIVNVASIMHRFAQIPDVEHFLQDWWEGGSYRNCKLALVGWSMLLQEKLRGSGAVVVCVDPGAVNSRLWATSRILGQPPVSALLPLIFAPPADACATTVHAVVTPEVVPSGYYARGVFTHPLVTGAISEPLAGVLSCMDWPLRRASGGRLASGIQAVPVSPAALNKNLYQELWEVCSELGGLPQDIL